LQVFINSRSELVKGSYNTKYVTVYSSFSCNYLGKSKSKARSTLQGQHVNGASAGEKGSNLLGLEFAKKVAANSWIFVIKSSPHCDTNFRLYVKKSLVSSLKSFEKLISVAA